MICCFSSVSMSSNGSAERTTVRSGPYLIQIDGVSIRKSTFVCRLIVAISSLQDTLGRT